MLRLLPCRADGFPPCNWRCARDDAARRFCAPAAISERNASSCTEDAGRTPPLEVQPGKASSGSPAFPRRTPASRNSPDRQCVDSGSRRYPCQAKRILQFGAASQNLAQRDAQVHRVRHVSAGTTQHTLTPLQRTYHGIIRAHVNVAVVKYKPIGYRTQSLPSFFI